MTGSSTALFPLYHLHALGALGDRGLDGLEPWLDHIAGLGCRGLLLTPIALSETHGYDTIDPFVIDPRLGGDDAFDRLVERCRARGLGLVLDGVFNHVGRSSAPFSAVLAGGAGSDEAAWFHIDPHGDHGDGFAYRCFEGHRRLVTLNHDHPAVLDWAVDVATHWLDRGTSGWRFDAAYAIPRPFLRAMTSRIRNRHPDAYLFGEVIHGDYSGIVRDTGLDSVTQYELHKAIWSSLRDGNFFELAHALERHAQSAAAFVPVTFAGNHDVTRIASQVVDDRHLVHAAALLFTLPGRPCLYYGDEFGWKGVKEHREGGDDAIRQELPLSPAIGDDNEAELLEVYRVLGALRRDRPWLDTGAVTVDATANRSFAFTVKGAASLAPGEHPPTIAVRLDLDDRGPTADGEAFARHGVSIRELSAT